MVMPVIRFFLYLYPLAFNTNPKTVDAIGIFNMELFHFFKIH